MVIENFAIPIISQIFFMGILRGFTQNITHWRFRFPFKVLI